MGGGMEVHRAKPIDPILGDKIPLMHEKKDKFSKIGKFSDQRFCQFFYDSLQFLGDQKCQILLKIAKIHVYKGTPIQKDSSAHNPKWRAPTATNK